MTDSLVSVACIDSVAADAGVLQCAMPCDVTAHHCDVICSSTPHVSCLVCWPLLIAELEKNFDEQTSSLNVQAHITNMNEMLSMFNINSRVKVSTQ